MGNKYMEEINIKDVDRNKYMEKINIKDVDGGLGVSCEVIYWMDI